MKVEIDKLKPLDTLVVKGKSYILVHVATYEYYKTKAEKGDEMKDIWNKSTDELMRSAYDIRQKQKQLEAIKSHFDCFPVSIRSVSQWIKQGRKILQSSEFHNKDEES